MIKTASYNIKSGEGIDGLIDLNRIAGVLADMDADIISLQEVDMNLPRSSCIDQAAYLADILKMEFAFGVANTYKKGSFGNAILSRYPIRNTVNHLLPAPNPKRAMLEIEIEADGKMLRLLNTHMELDRHLRLKQIQEFIVPLVLSGNVATILCGDLNEGPDGAGVTYLYNYLQDSFQTNSGIWTNTFPADHPAERIDYILFNQFCAAVNYKIIPSLASDHLPIMAEIDF